MEERFVLQALARYLIKMDYRKPLVLIMQLESI